MFEQVFKKIDDVLWKDAGCTSELDYTEHIDQKTFDLSVKNPDGGEVIAHRSPQEIMAEIAALDAESAAGVAQIKTLLRGDMAHD